MVEASRRSLVALAAFCAAARPASAAPASADVRLSRLCAELRRRTSITREIGDRMRAAENGPEVQGPLEAELSHANDEFFDMLDRIAAEPAYSTRGIVEKAGALKIALEEVVLISVDPSFDEPLDIEDALAMSLVQDVLRLWPLATDVARNGRVESVSLREALQAVVGASLVGRDAP